MESDSNKLNVGRSTARTVLIGSAPSSGSTMLADLMDSFPNAVCGPELEFFCDPNLYDFESFKKKPNSRGDLFSLGNTGIFPRMDRIHSYGMSVSTLNTLIQTSNSLDEFINKFRSSYLDFRNIDPDGIWFEKTPQNVNVIGPWLQANNGHRFIFLIRDPLYVFNSLLNRGWTLYAAGATWLLYVAKIWPYIHHERVHVLRLEDLVDQPFEQAIALMNSLGIRCEINPDDLAAHFAKNEYRKQHSIKKKSWEINTHERTIGDPNRKIIDPTVMSAFAELIQARVTKGMANRFDLAMVSMEEAMRQFGYHHECSAVGRGNRMSVFVPTLKDKKRFAIKTIRSMIQGKGSGSDFHLYCNAIER